MDHETVWLRQKQMAELFGRDRSVITRHVGNVFKEGELDEKSNVQNLHIAGSDKPVALALLVAESLPDQKELMVRLIEHFVLLRADEEGKT